MDLKIVMFSFMYVKEGDVIASPLGLNLSMNNWDISDSFVKINPIYSEFDPKFENEIIFKLISKNFYLIEKIIIMNEHIISLLANYSINTK